MVIHKIKFKKHLKRFITVVFILLVLITSTIFLTKPTAEAGWFNDGWSYRQPITFTHNASITSEQRVTVSFRTDGLVSAGKMKSTCADARFTDANGKLLRYQYLANCNTGSNTTFDVVFPTINNGANLAYFYYGNPTATSGSTTVSSVASLSPSGGGPAAGSESIGPGPIAYWRFDDGYGTSASDASDHSYTASFSNSPTWAAEDLCVSGKCLKFPGTNASLTVASTISVNSVSLWVKSATNSAALITLATNTYIKASSGTITTTGFTSPTIYVNGIAGSTLTANQWQHITVTTGTAISATAITIARASNNYLQGFMDEVKLYPYARTAAQIKADYNSRGSPDSVNVQIGPDTNKSLSNGLVGYWKMDENTGSTVADSSGNGASGTLYNGAAFTVGKFGSSISYTGNTNLIELGDNDLLDRVSGESLTISTWVYRTSVASDYFIFAKKASNDAQVGYEMEQWSSGNGGDTCLYLGDNTNLATACTASGSTTTLNTWQHIVAVYDNSTRTISMYINGVSSSDPGSLSVPSAMNSSANGYCARIGSVGYSSTCDGTANGTTSFIGRIDDTRVYKRALSPSEVSQLYNWTPNPVGWWKMDEGSGLTVYDSAGNSHNATLRATDTKRVTGKYGGGIYVNSLTSNDPMYVSGDVDDFDIRNRSFTVGIWEKWISSNGSTINDYISRKGYGEPYWRLYTENGIANFEVNDGTNTATATSTTYWDDGSWYYLTGVVDRAAGYIYVYADGIRIGSAAINFGDVNTTHGLEFGCADDCDSGSVEGVLDNAVIYNYARTPKQIIEDMNAGHPAPGSPVGSSLVTYKFDEATGTTLNNSGNLGSAANATVSGTLWNLDGKFYSAQQFKGSATSYISSPKMQIVADNNITYNTLSWGGWFKPTSTAASKTLVIKRNEFRLTTDASSRPNCAIYYSGSWQTAAIGITALPLNSWSHVLCTYDGSNIIVYVNGVPANGPVAQTNNLTSSSSYGLNLGWNTTGGEYFRGLMDDIKVYDSALTADQVKLEYNKGSSLVLGNLTTSSDGISASNSASREFCIPGDTGTCSPPIGWWKLDENTSTVITDSSGHGLSGSTVSSPAWVQGKTGSALSFNGSSNYATITDNALLTLDPTVSYTWSFWVNPRDMSSTTDHVIWSQLQNNQNFFEFTADSSTGDPWAVTNGIAVGWISGLTNGVITHSNDNVLSNNTWAYVTITYDSSQTAANRINIYINGVDQTNISSRSSSTAPATINPGANSTRINSDSVWGQYLNATIDDFKYYNYLRTPAQIAWDYNHGRPVAYYKFDECQGSTLYNSAINGNGDAAGMNGTWAGGTAIGSCETGSTAWGNGATGKYGSSLSFNGTSDYTTSSLISTATDNITFSAWINWAGATSKNQYIIQNGNFDTPGDGWGVFLDHSDSDHLHFDNTWSGGAATSFTPTIGTWYHIAGTQKNGIFSLYVNGIQIYSANPGTGMFTPTTRTAIGSDGQGFDDDFKGQIDEVKIYNYALTPTQIKTLYNGGSAVSF